MKGYNPSEHLSEEESLPLSGIQHMAFCERQWALIHLEQQWNENLLTVEGKQVHNVVDNPFANESRNEAIITRSVSISSRELGLHGIADVVEYIRDDDSPAEFTTELKGRDGRWKVVPIEYKRGRKKVTDVDEVQLCAQAICLEELYHIEISSGYLYYFSTKSRDSVNFDSYLRKRVRSLAARMHEMFTSGHIPSAIKESHCNRCSLYEICQPDWKSSKFAINDYLRSSLSEVVSQSHEKTT